jgi:tRNA dimethylallyltransferase
VGIECALLLNGEIVSADSMQVYRGMDIGTAKPSAEQRRHVPHHLIDVVNPDEEFSVALYKEKAERVIDDILPRGRRPILVGGSGLYVRAVTGQWRMTAAPKDEAFRERLRNEAREQGLAALHARLREVDPESAARIPLSDEKRLLRALEVFETTGLPISHFHRLDCAHKPKYDVSMIGLTLPRPSLYARIEARIDKMMVRGLLQEVERLREKGCHAGLVSMKALGYSHLLRCLAGEFALETAVRLFKRDTRRFAKRQMTWFRAEPSIHWLDIEGRSPAEAAKEIADSFKSSRRRNACS